MRFTVVLVLTSIVVATPARADAPWERLASNDGAVVDVVRGKVPKVRTTKELPYDAATVIAVLADLERFPGWFPGLAAWEVVRDERGAFAYGRRDLPWPLTDRDWYVRYDFGKDGDAYTIRAGSVPGHALVDGSTRLTDVLSRWRIEPRGPSRCVVSYDYDVPAPGIPDVALEGMWKSEGPTLLRALQGEVARRAR